jgi:hypothetical protein
LLILVCSLYLTFLGGNIFESAVDKGNNSGYAIGAGIGAEFAFKIRKISEYQSLRDVLCDAESLAAKLKDLQKLLVKTSNKKKKTAIEANIKKLEKASEVLSGRHQEMKECKAKTKKAKSELIDKVVYLLG